MKLRLTDIKGLVAVFRHVKKVFYTILFRVTNTKIMPAYSCFIVILLFSLWNYLGLTNKVLSGNSVSNPKFRFVNQFSGENGKSLAL